MYRYEKRESKIKKIFLMIVYTAIIIAITIYLYNFYLSINVEKKELKSNAETIRLSTETKKEEENNNTSIKEVTKSIVGISKIKDVGDSILMSSKIEELGLGTGMLVSNNRVYSNKLACCR